MDTGSDRLAAPVAAPVRAPRSGRPSAEQARFLPNPKQKDDSVEGQFARLSALMDDEEEEGADDVAARLTGGGPGGGSGSVYAEDSRGGSGSTLGDVRRVCFLAAPIILSNITVPLTGAVDIAIVGRLGDASFLGGVAVGSLLFDYVYWGLGFVKMGTTGLTANAFGACSAAGSDAASRQRGREQLVILMRAVLMAVVFGSIVLLASEIMLSLLFSVRFHTKCVCSVSKECLS